jgi:hypothetical protein
MITLRVRWDYRAAMFPPAPQRAEPPCGGPLPAPGCAAERGADECGAPSLPWTRITYTATEYDAGMIAWQSNA